MKIKFTKMHGAGNDFVVLDAVNQAISLTPAQWQFIADRRFGIGADQMLVVEKAQGAGVDFRYRIYNADGGEVEQCGNGARAFVRFVTEKGLTDKRAIRVETMSGVIEPRLEEDGQITVDMGAPILTPAEVPFDSRNLQHRQQADDTLWPLEVAGKTTWISVVSMGNPHAVQVVEDSEAAPVLVEGPLIEHHARFPKRVNAGFMQVLDRHHIRLRVYERGAGETLACGTGACAAVVAGIRRGLLDSPVAVQTHGGLLNIAWAGPGAPVMMTGPAVTVFEGEIELPDQL
ncbi:diaminopimelate epimerase [Herbaspirillum rubrisubalbicans]|uniref:Diaminopimelate epimerase n=1 Tax=Herbaspirillum rubrisubalbicans TaxID=80842 RepID=A0AAD0UBI6_9BURK|nr:diaminopimelate epimerase [Herbaspirillum rubrisubalbicans]ALU91363.1 diaminopimelate epimerase protein [Herbaspirillum rubrisubalbicans M1]AYR26388.1 diaminopimelate epimerase [Herbaspirillum rubrisubalbicans]